MEYPQKIKSKIILNIVFLLLIGIGFTWFTAYNSKRELEQDLLRDAKLAASSINQNHILALKGEDSDSSLASYLRLKQQLSAEIKFVMESRFLYLMTIKDNKICFYLDSEPIGSKDESKPGSIYKDAPADLKAAFKNESEMIAHPFADKWGTWQSVFVPIKDSKGKMIAMLGLDISNKSWNIQIFEKCLLPVILVLIALIFVFLSFLLGFRAKTARIQSEEIRVREEKFRKMFFNHDAVMLLVEPISGQIIDANVAAVKFYGFTFERLVSMNIAEINCMNESEMKQMRMKALDGVKNDFVFKHRLSDNSIKIVEVHSSSFETNGQTLLFSIINDITEKQSALDKIAESELRFRELADNVDQLFILRTKYKALYVNDNFEKIFGVPKERMFENPDCFLDYIIKEDADRLGREVKHENFKEDGNTDKEFRILRPDGEIRWLWARTSLIADKDGLEDRIAIVVSDITEKQNALTRMAESEERLRELSENVDQAFIIRTREKNLFISPRFSEIFGISEEKMSESPDNFLALIIEEDRAKILNNIENVDFKETGYTNDEYRIVRPDNGEIRWIWSKTFPVFEKDGSINKIAVVVSDITDKKTMEIELFDKEEKFSAIISASPDGIGMADLHMNITLMSDSLVEMYGYSIDEKELYIGRNIYEFIDESSHELLTKNIKKIIRCEIIDIAEYVAKKKDGSLFYVDVNSTILKNPEGKSIGVLFVQRNVTLRKESEEKVRIATENFASIFRISPDAIVITRASDGIITDVNEQFVQSSGYSREELVGFTSGDMIAYESMEVRAEVVREMKENGGFQNKNIRFGTKYNTKIDCILSSKLIILGEIPHFITTLRDVTKLKEIENKLKINEENFRTFFNSIDDFLFVLDEQGSIINANDTVYRRLGFSDEELMGKPVLVVHPEERRNEALQIVGEMLAGKTDFCSVPLQTKYGKLIQVETRIYPGTWNGIPALFGVTKDLTKIKQTEERFAKAFNSGSNIMAITEFESGNLIDVNDAFLEFFGYSKTEVIGKTTTELNLYFDINDRMRIMTEAIDKGTVKNIEVCFRAKNKKIKTVLFTITKIDIGELPFWLTSMVDISKRKKLELDLIDAKEMAEAASSAKSEFLANMSHEIRTPLNGVIGFTDLLMRTDMNAMQKNYMHSVNSSANSLLDLINDILDFSKIEAGKLELNPEKVDIFDLIDQLIDIIKYRIHEKGLEVLVDICPTIPQFVVVDPIRLRQVLLNLLSNAVKFTEKGEIELKVTMNEVADGDNEFTFSIIDTGIGIPEDKQARIFESFSQADGSTTRKYGGTGLGLSISCSLVAKMGSQIQVESEVGKGSRFYFTVKLPSENLQPIVYLDMKFIQRVLVIDDNANNRNIIEAMLQKQQIVTDQAADGIDGLAKIAKTNYDVIIIDYHMPIMDGLEVIRRIKKDATERNVNQPIVFLHSSSDDEHIANECSLLNVDVSMVKPVKMKQLFDALSRLNKVDENIDFDLVEEQLPLKVVASPSFKVLIVDDNLTNIALASAFVANILPSAMLLKANNGKEAVALFDEFKPDIVFMDIQMPEMNGYEATKLIRTMEIQMNIHTPIIALTAGMVLGEKDRCLEAGMDDFLSKPVLLDSIKSLVNKYLLQKNKSQEIISSASDLDVIETKAAEVLIVDDNLTVVTQVSAYVKKILPNAIVHRAKNGFEAVELYEQLNPHFVFMDIQMPVMDGYEATLKIRKIEHRKGTHAPIVALTSGTMKEDKDKCLNAGMDCFVSKPISFQDAENVLLQYLTLYPIANLKNANEIHPEAISQVEDFAFIPDFADEKKSIVKNGHDAYIIMIVDDNNFILELTETFVLQVYPNAHVLKEKNGYFAVEQFKKIIPDFIFMDIQMPVMNGYEATAEIRRLERKLNIHTPIVAFSTITQLEEKNRWKKEGMDNLISKEVEYDVIRNILNQYLGKKNDVDTVGINILEHFDEAEMMERCMCNIELFGQMIDIAIATMLAYITDLKNAIEADDNPAIKFNAHSIKGVALGCSFVILAEIALDLEAVDLHTKTDKRRLIASLENEFEIIKHIIGK